MNLNIDTGNASFKGKKRLHVDVDTAAIGPHKIRILKKDVKSSSQELDHLVQVTAHFRAPESALISDPHYTEAKKILESKALHLLNKYEKKGQLGNLSEEKLNKLKNAMDNLGLFKSENIRERMIALLAPNPPTGFLPHAEREAAVKIIRDTIQADPQDLRSLIDPIAKLSQVVNQSVETPTYEAIAFTIQELEQEVDQWNSPRMAHLKQEVENVFASVFIRSLEHEKNPKTINLILERLAKMGDKADFLRIKDIIPKEQHKVLALVYQEHNPGALCENIQHLHLDDETRLSFAKQISKNRSFLIFSTLRNFGIQNENDRYDIVKLALESDPMAVQFLQTHLKNFDLHDKKHLEDLAKRAATAPSIDYVITALEIIRNFDISDKSTCNEICIIVAKQHCAAKQISLYSENGIEYSFFDDFFLREESLTAGAADFFYHFTLDPTHIITYIQSLSISDPETTKRLVDVVSIDRRKFARPGIYYPFREEISFHRVSLLEQAWSAPVDPSLLQKAREVWHSLPPIGQINPAKYQHFCERRMNLSNTLVTRHEHLQEQMKQSIAKWYECDSLVKAKAMSKEPITREFLCKINEILDHNGIECGKIRQIPINAGYRADHEYLHQDYVEVKLNAFIDWLNAELQACDEGKSNPIVVSALAYQRFVSIHPFKDANGRTGRMVMDYVLQRNGLPPAVLEKNTFAIFSWSSKNKTPSDALQYVLEGVRRSYELIS